MEFGDEEYIRLLEVTFTAEERSQLAKEGKAKPDGSFPIRNKSDLQHAIDDFGRGGATASDKAWIKKRAKELDAEDMLPDNWKEALGEPEQPSVSDSPLHFGGQILEAVGTTGKEWEVLLIEKGTSKNKFRYSAQVLQEAAPLFEGAYSYADHTNDQEQRVRPERSVKDKVGRFSNVKYGQATVNGKIVEGLKARYKVIAPWLRDLLKESVEMGEPDFVGFSIDAFGKHNRIKEGGQVILDVQKIFKVNSVDVVTNPSAGGRLVRLVASHSEREQALDPEEGTEGGGGTATKPAQFTLTAEQLAEIVREQVANVLKEAAQPTVEALQQQATELASIKEATRIRENKEKYTAAVNAAEGLSAQGKQRLLESFAEVSQRRDLTDEEILERVKETASYEGAVKASVMGSKPTAYARTSAMVAQEDRYYQALVGMFEDVDQKIGDTSIPRFRSIKEAYCRWTGRDSFEVDPMEIQAEFSCRYDSARDHKRIQESVNTATWGQVYADVLYLSMMKYYRINPAYNRWRPVVSDIDNAPDFQLRHWTRLGGYGDLPVVPEAGTYQPLVSSTNEEVRYQVSKRGGLDDVTFEAIANDRIGAIRSIPVAMARSAARTLFKFVMNMITTDNPVMGYDSTTLYHTNHANTGSTALSLTGLQTVTTGMRQQTAFSETLEILGERNKPKIVIVPTALEYVAQRLLMPSDAYAAAIANPSTEQSLDPQAFKGDGKAYIVYDQLSSTTGWYAVADPAEVNTMVIGFLNGREDPELFVQDMPTVGSNFTADKTTYKVRHIYGGVIEDHRSFYRGNT